MVMPGYNDSFVCIGSPFQKQKELPACAGSSHLTYYAYREYNQYHYWKYESQHEHPELIKSIHFAAFIDIQLVHRYTLVDDKADKQGRHKGADRKHDIGDEEVHIIKDRSAEYDDVTQDTIGQRRWNARQKYEEPEDIGSTATFALIALYCIGHIDFNH